MAIKKQMMYYLSVFKGEEEIVRRIPFDDYNKALMALLDYYKPKRSRSTLVFTTEVINGQFARSYVELNLPEEVSEIKDKYDQRRYDLAAKRSTSFEYKASYNFLIESEIGIKDLEDFLADDE